MAYEQMRSVAATSQALAPSQPSIQLVVETRRAGAKSTGREFDQSRLIVMRISGVISQSPPYKFVASTATISLYI